MKPAINELPKLSNSVEDDIHPHHGFITRDKRNTELGHKSGVIWLTGLSGSGKSTIANQVERMLFQQGFTVSILDGDTLRTGLNKDLDFTKEGREENLRRTGEVAALFAKSGHIVLASFISPHHKGRESVKNIIGENFYLAHVDADIDDCISRDPKGLYKKAMFGGIENFTGVGQDYEKPQQADLTINTSGNSIAECTMQLVSFIKSNFTL
ncbi:MAG: adenylyl-sulfate kinase [Gammaproteobacteria bacterium]|nr:adenylyl-sulfate kinase [Gammaproteobacteria bacterium]MCW8987921.1 adenylyl-sulfate kinase [Gammaproteobacteria bacterium]MCW9029971.1 adenylyl-sulfate kinase [Gammaproteobacteria bacterium]